MRALMRALAPSVILLITAYLAAEPGALRLSLRSRVEVFKGSGAWEEVQVPFRAPISQTAVVICDMWDNHWCKGAASRVEVLARKASPLVELARERGMLIIHAPSDTMSFYEGTPQRLAAASAPKAEPPPALTLVDPPLPIDDRDGGCDTPGDKQYKAWSRQHATIRVAPGDLVSDKGAEVYSVLKQRGIGTLFVMGVHTNMCVLNRSFAIKQMTKWGIRCILIRDLTDAMYDPQDSPFVPHDQGTELVIQHIEKYWAPSVHSPQLMQALKAK